MEMKITKVEAFHVDWAPGRSAWVRITSEDGTFGLGEASPMGGGNASLEIIARYFAPELTGANALDHRVLQDRLLHHHIKIGLEGAFAGALAAVDIALWDLKGKLLGQPIYQLLGGAWRTELPFYASVGGNAERKVEDVCRAVESWLPLQPSLVKIRFDGDKTQRDVDIPGDIAKARAVRQLVGNDLPLAFDANNTYSIQGAIRVGRALEELGYEWFEEPMQHYHTRSFEKVAGALDIAIAAGEQEYTLQGIARLIEAGVAIVQPDIVKTGGFTGLSDMAALARAQGVDFLPHQTQPSIGHVANLHFVAAQTHAHYPCEYNDKSGRQNIVFAQPIAPQDGQFQLPSAPGLGLEINGAELSRRMRIWN
jgi:L-alanine-DL-glutamate epimerase-like enolase superfamily enzyme